MIDDQIGEQDLLSKSEIPIPYFKSSKIFASSYTLNRAENRVVFKWLVGEGGDDIRYRLHSFLAKDSVQKNFDIILIDCPPRLLTATANAVCASTHVLVPTILDDLSASATINTIASIFKLRETLSPALRILGVVPTFVQVKTKFNRRETSALDYLKAELPRFQKAQDTPVVLFEDERILRKEAIATAAGQTVAYFESDEVRDMFEKLGAEITSRLGSAIAERANAGREADRGVAAAEKGRIVTLRG